MLSDKKHQNTLPLPQLLLMSAADDCKLADAINVGNVLEHLLQARAKSVNADISGPAYRGQVNAQLEQHYDSTLGHALAAAACPACAVLVVACICSSNMLCRRPGHTWLGWLSMPMAMMASWPCPVRVTVMKEMLSFSWAMAVPTAAMSPGRSVCKPVQHETPDGLHYLLWHTPCVSCKVCLGRYGFVAAGCLSKRSVGRAPGGTEQC